MGQVMNLIYEFKDACVYDLKEVNSSFAAGSLKVLYTGANRNGSVISRDAVQAALPSLYNVPIVSHYDFDENVIGGHDVAVTRRNDGTLQLRTLTEPCGVVPEHAKFRFETDTDENGNVHEYLIIEGVLLWKRQDVYRHIVDDLDGCVKHSMEITVNDGEYDPDSGLYRIKNFEFTALCLLELYDPCFQGSQLELYSASRFKEQMAQMMAELRETFTLVTSSTEDDDTHSQNHSKEGGMALSEKLALIEQYGLIADGLDFSIEELSLDELREKLEAIKTDETYTATGVIDESDKTFDDGSGEDSPEDSEPAESESEEVEPVETDDGDDDVPAKKSHDYALAGQIAEDLSRALSVETVEMPWGEDTRYWYWDYDPDKMEVYCTDCTDWLLYGFTYRMDGDVITIDFASKKRMKLVVADYESGVGDSYSSTLSAFADKYSGEIASLSEFKRGVENAALNEQREEVLSHFAELIGVEAFDELKEHASEYSVGELEEKCYAIRGRFGMTKFSLEQKQPKLPINKTKQAVEPYGGLFVKYNVAMTD